MPSSSAVAPDDYEHVHHFVCTSCWDPAQLEHVLARKAQAIVGGREAVLIIDDTALLPSEEPGRCRAAQAPEERLVHRTKPEIALEELDRMMRSGVTFGCVTADAG